MIRLILPFLLVASAYAQTDGEMRQHLIKEEGYRLRPYLVRGIPHVGIGHRVHGTPHSISPSEAESLFIRDLSKARHAARTACVTFDNQPHDVKIILIGLAYNLGSTGLYRFTAFRSAVDNFDYWTAALELRKSLWRYQLPARCSRYAAILDKAGLANFRIQLDISRPFVQPHRIQ